MKKIRPCLITPEVSSIISYHYQILGKEVDDREIKMLFDVLVANNNTFPDNEHIEVVLKAFFDATHYGSVEMKGTSIRSHSLAFTEWLRGRTNMRQPTDHYSAVPPKPDNWQYDPDEPLPPEITKAKAKELLDIIAKLYEGDMKRLFKNKNFMHYTDKLKERYYE